MMKRISLQLIVAVLFLFSTAHAATFTVNSNGDGADAGIDGICDDGSGNCTMRAAIEEANATVAADIINFSAPFNINLATGLPNITQPLTINGTYIGGPAIELDGTAIGGAGLLVAASAAGTTIYGLNIHGFGGQGILIAANNCTVAGCYIGTNLSGTAAQANGDAGITIAALVSNIRIGGSGTDSINVISGNTVHGINISPDCDNITIINSRIGTNFAGTAAISNGAHGITATTMTNLTIGSATASDRNIISGNTAFGILLVASSSINILGNYVGVDMSGNIALGNNSFGVQLSGCNNAIIGGQRLDSSNVIAANAFIGLDIVGGSSQIAIRGNNIGVGVSGTIPLGNTSHGIQVFQSSDITIGGRSYLTKNTISDNGSMGILLNESSNINVFGNFIGTDILGTTEIGNSSHGIQLQGLNTNVVIGGSRYIEGNIISGNGGAGVNFDSPDVNPSVGTIVKGNLIGTDSTTTQDFGNFVIGIILKASDCIIGDTANNEGNVIGGTDLFCGILVANSSNNTIIGNYIGVGLDSTSNIGNEQDGILIAVENAGRSANDNIVTNNLIAFNDRFGVNVGLALNSFSSSDETGNIIRFNQTYCNDSLGIFLNLTNPPDQGNNGNPTPQINTAMSTDSMIVGIQDPALANQLIDVYIMVDCPSCDINPQGKIWVDSAEVSPTGEWSYDFGAPIPGSLVVTATDASGNTSQFSTCLDPCSALAVLEANNEVLLGPNDPVTLNLMGSNSQFSTLNPTLPEFYWVIGNDTIATSADTVVTFQYNGGGGNYAEGNYQITLIAQQASCVDTATISVDAIYFYVPNMITPNGDQINDAFQITTEEGRYNVEIYNRWGKRIYVEEGYTDGWQPGSEVSDGLYYYSIVDPVGSLGEFKGWVYVVR